jgi:hypothetical protein
MRRIGMVVLGSLLAVSLSYGQGSVPAPAQAAIGHGAFPAKVTKTLDSSKLKQDDPFEIETTGSFKLPDGTLVPKGSKLMGHVTAAKSRSNGDPDSKLTLAFDKLSILGGRQFALKGAVQAVFPPAQEVDPGVPGSSLHQGAGGVGPGAGHFAAPDYKPSDIKTGSSTETNSAETVADPKSVGVHGIDNLQLEDGIIFSKGKNVKLSGGTRMIVRADIIG